MINKLLQPFVKFKTWFVKLAFHFKILILIIFLGIFWFGYTKINSGKPKTQYQTAKAEKGTLIISVSGSGTVSTANNSIVSTQASGVVSKLYVIDGDTVKTGDKIAEIDLDLEGQQKAAQALSSYQSAKNSLESAKTTMFSLQSDMFAKWDEYYNLATSGKYQNGDGSPKESNRALPEFHIASDDWLASEAKYKNQQAVINQAQTALNSAWLSYQRSSSTVYAPIPGTVSGLSLQIGSVIAATSSNSNSTQTSTKIASVKTKALPTVTVNLTEIDVPKIKMGNKATVTFDALPDKTFTGQVVSIDTAGVTSSNVTTYPTVIRLDLESNEILTNMAASANIITTAKDNVLIVPSTGIQNQNGENFVQIMQNGQIKEVGVEIGLASDTQTEIISGISEGDTVITSTIAQTNSFSGSSQSSPFSGFGGMGGFRQSGGVRINR